MPNFSDDILDYLRQNHGELVGTMDMLYALTRRIKDREQRRLIRGKILSDLSSLIQEKKVVRYRKIRMVKKIPRRSQGLLRISEIWV